MEQIEPYASLLLPVWQGRGTDYNLITSSLTLLETLVGPNRAGDAVLAVAYRRLLQQSSDLRLAPISDAVLERAALIRSTTRLRTPDAIHAAIALIEGSTLVLTNDAGLRQVEGLPVTVLSEVVAP